jgi:L-amino acid N-acyltransferase YncA
MTTLSIQQDAGAEDDRDANGYDSHLLSFNCQMKLSARAATPDDAARIAQIYNEGIEDRVGTFETRPRSEADVRAWFDGRHPIIVVETSESETGPGSAPGRIIAFASTSNYRARECYAGIAEFSVYVARDGRGKGAGRVAMVALIGACVPAGIWKLLSRVFVENTASRALLQSVGFREVGTYEKHAQLDGEWRDVVIVERLIPENIHRTAPVDSGQAN